MNSQEPKPPESKLESWKEIAAYLQRDAKTAQRWEKEEGLPVHRHSHNRRSSVYAYPAEIDAWRLTRKTAVEPAPVQAPSLWRAPTFALAILLGLMMVGNGVRPQTVLAWQGKILAKGFLCGTCGEDATFTRDGRTELFKDYETNDLVLRNMSSGKTTKLGIVPETDWAGSPILSPDRKQIVYNLGPGNKGQQQLAIVANHAGAKPRVLLGKPAYINYGPVAWFPDGRSVLAGLIIKPDFMFHIARVSIADGAVTELKSVFLDEESESGGSALSLSADGRYIAYSAPTADPDKLARGVRPDIYIHVMRADGSQDTEIVKSSGHNSNPVWTPDGRRILFTSDRSGTNDLWSVPMENGKAAGPESLVSADVGNIDARGIYGGSLYYTLPHYSELIHIAKVGSEGASATAPVVGVSPSWSPDGRSIAFKRHRAENSSQYDLVVRSLETGAEKTYSTTLGTSGPGAPLWFHDGKSLMTGIRRSDGSISLDRIDVAGGEFKELPGPGPAPSAISPDDKTRYMVSRQTGAADRILAIDVETGKENQIFESRDTTPLTIGLSPDGRTLALGWGPNRAPGSVHIARVSIDGSGYRELYTADRFFWGTVAWTKDGRSILFNQERGERVGHPDVMQIPAEGGVAEKFAVGSNRNFDLSPDGSRLVYGAVGWEFQLWALDNVLAALK